MDIKNISERDIIRIADSEAVRKRGLRYYRTGMVSHMKIRGDTIVAEVEGSYEDSYNVEIGMDENGYIDADCDCPFDGYACKHVVAVLYKWIYEKNRFEILAHTNHAPKNKGPSLEDLKFEDTIRPATTERLVKAFDIINNDEIAIKSQNAEHVLAEVNSPQKHTVIIRVDDSYWDHELAVSKKCTCTSPWNPCCEHILAVLLTLLKKTNPEAIPKNYESKLREKLRAEKYSRLVAELERAFDDEEITNERKYKILFNITRTHDNISLSVEKALFLKRGGIGKSSIITEKYIEEHKQDLSYNKKKVFNVLIASLKSSYDYYYNSKLFKKKFSDELSIELLRSLKTLYLEEPDCFANCHFPNENANLEIHLEEEGGVYTFKLVAKLNDKPFNLKDVALLGEGPFWVYTNNERPMLFELECENYRPIQYLLNSFGAEIKATKLKDFIEKYYMNLCSVGKVVLPEKHKIEETSDIKPKPRLFLKDYGGNFSIELKYLYGDIESSSGDNKDIVFKNKDGKIVKIERDIEAEKQSYAILMDNQVAEHNGILTPSIDPLLWLSDVTKNLISQGFEIYGQSELVNQRINMEEPQLRIDLSSGIDWFDLKMDVSIGEEKVPLDKVVAALNNHERFIKLSDGSVGVIPQKWLNKLSGAIGFLKKGEKKNRLKAANNQIAIIESLLDIADKTKVDKKFKTLKEKFKKFKGIKNATLPKNLKGELRDYQKAGYNWLHFLKEFSFGGCLADEMGLGKTVQALSMLLHEKENGNKTPSLVVVPRSLVFNWVNEVEKFTPTLRTHVHHGTERLRTIAQIKRKKPDLIITTYATLRNDIDIFKKETFHYVILDESQQIKNPLSKNTKSVYSLKSRYSLIMTGTPIENNSLELWSQFAFLNPGLLGSMEHFKSAFTKKIDKDKDKSKAKVLKNTINPFLLLRKKETVAKELPDKQVTVLYCDMENKQREFYENWKEKFKQEIKKTIKEKGLAKSKFKILQGLTVLRQICNHPALIDESFVGNSGKLNLLLNQIKEVINEGHKVLVFSSFVKMLKVFKNHFSEKGIKFSYLDGQTTNREKAVEEFQQNKNISVFLISLKAGGLGLNLAEADYVFIVDPWWNPAAEMQAIDRAHRIGQKNKVFVYKAITKDSVEEKILELQESKLDLVKNVITVEEGIFKKLTQKDINKMFM